MIITNGGSAGRFRQKVPSHFQTANSRTRLIKNQATENRNFGVGSQTVRPFASARHLSHPTITRNSAIMSHVQARSIPRIRLVNVL